MDLLPKIEVQIQRAVCGALYKSALSQNQQPCAAFILGSTEDIAKPRFDFALIAVASKSWNALNVEGLVSGLEQQLDSIRQVAKDFQRDLISVGIAWDKSFLPNKHAQFGLLVDFARQHNIPYVLEVPVTGGESIWGLSVYFSNRFPHNSLQYKMVSRKPKAAIENPRRIKRVWKQVLMSTVSRTSHWT
jgi:hypothetical protein